MKKFLFWIDRFHWLWLILAGAWIFLAEPRYTPVLLVIPALWLLHGWVEKSSAPHGVLNFLPLTPLNPSILLLALMLLVSLWATYDIAVSLEKISSLSLGLGVFFMVAQAGKRPAGWWLCLTAFLGSGLAFSLISLLSTNWAVRFNVMEPIIYILPAGIRGLPRAAAGIHYNAVGGTLLWVLPLLWVFSAAALQPKGFFSFNWIKGKGWNILYFLSRHKLGWALVLLLGVSTLITSAVFLLSQSRGSYLALLLTLFGLGLIVLPPRGRWIFSAGSLGLVSIITYLVYRSGEWAAWINRLGLSSQEGFSIDSLEARLEIWSRAIYGIQDFSFTGMGMGTFRHVVHVLYPLFQISPDSDLIVQAHNEFLQVALYLGIPGLIAFLSIYLVSFWMLGAIWKQTAFPLHITKNAIRVSDSPKLTVLTAGSKAVRLCVLGLGGGLMAHFIYGFTDAIILRAPGIFWWMLLGLIAGLHQQVFGEKPKRGVEE
ncbi:MAG: O-antigen ligase family protein [Chloroflexi bacterium]|nr:O-antigen ligase family protein [Chloroflexota bacterium]